MGVTAQEIQTRGRTELKILYFNVPKIKSPSLTSSPTYGKPSSSKILVRSPRKVPVSLWSGFSNVSFCKKNVNLTISVYLYNTKSQKTCLVAKSSICFCRVVLSFVVHRAKESSLNGTLIHNQAVLLIVPGVRTNRHDSILTRRIGIKSGKGCGCSAGDERPLSSVKDVTVHVISGLIVERVDAKL